MKKNVNHIDNLLILEKQFRDEEKNTECLDVCLKILNEIKMFSHNEKYSIISKLFLFENQSNYVRIHLMHELFQDNNFIDSRTIKKNIINY